MSYPAVSDEPSFPRNATRWARGQPFKHRISAARAVRDRGTRRDTHRASAVGDTALSHGRS